MKSETFIFSVSEAHEEALRLLSEIAPIHERLRVPQGEAGLPSAAEITRESNLIRLNEMLHGLRCELKAARETILAGGLPQLLAQRAASPPPPPPPDPLLSVTERCRQAKGKTKAPPDPTKFSGISRECATSKTKRSQ